MKKLSETKIINFIGAPGVGKSTTAAELFCIMKKMNYSVEIVQEFAKELVYSDSSTLKDQIYVTASQHHRIFKLKDKVDYIITDSPIILGAAYTTDPVHRSFIKHMFFLNTNITFFIKHSDKIRYEQNSRQQNKIESLKKEKEIKDLLDFYDIKYNEIDTQKFGFNIFDTVKNLISV